MSKREKISIEFKSNSVIPEFGDYANDSKLIKRTGLYINKYIARLIKDGEDLSQYSQFLENIVEEQFFKCFQDLKKQHSSRLNIIKKAFQKRRADKEEFSSFLSLIELELSSTEEEFKTVENIYKNFNPLYNGKLSFEDESED